MGQGTEITLGLYRHYNYAISVKLMVNCFERQSET